MMAFTAAYMGHLASMCHGHIVTGSYTSVNPLVPWKNDSRFRNIFSNQDHLPKTMHWVYSLGSYCW